MNIYFIVEGKRTESKVYPAWLSYLAPNIRKISFFDEPDKNTYKIVNANGQPFYPEISDAINEVNSVGKYDYLVLCLDAEDYSVDEVEADIHCFLEKEQLKLDHAELILIVQNRCIETWFLGNRRIYSRNPQNPVLAEYTNYYEVSAQDPEQMGKYRGFNTHAHFHEAYLQALFAEKNLSYTKKYPGHVLDETYLKQLKARIHDEPNHLITFQNFIKFCNRIRPNPAKGEIAGKD